MIDIEDDFALALEAFNLFGDESKCGHFIIDGTPNKGYPPHNKWKKHPPEVIAKMRAARLANPTGTAGKTWTVSDTTAHKEAWKRRRLRAGSK